MNHKGYVINLESETETNEYYRKVLYTVPSSMQLVVMSLEPGEDIPMEIHKNQSQFIRIESGYGTLVMDNVRYELSPGTGFIVPYGTPHWVINTSNNEKLKLYSIYAPPEHPVNRLDIDQPL